MISALYKKLVDISISEYPNIIEDCFLVYTENGFVRKLRFVFVDESIADIFISEKRYSYHWQASNFLFRFDTSPHWEEISTYHHHLHHKKNSNVKESEFTDNHKKNILIFLDFVKKRIIE